MKPWGELTDLEKAVAIAQRIGWENRDEYWHAPADSIVAHEIGVRVRAEGLPYWHNDNGLAFAEVWPKLFRAAEQVTLLNTPHICFSRGAGWEDVEGDTYAEVICRAAYLLLPVPEPVPVS